MVDIKPLCVARRLAVASAQAADELPYVKKIKAILDQLCRFYDNSQCAQLA